MASYSNRMSVLIILHTLLEVIYVRTQVVFQRHAGAAATAAAATELSRVSPGIFPFNWGVFRRLEPRKSLPRGQYRNNGPSHHPTVQYKVKRGMEERFVK